MNFIKKIFTWSFPKADRDIGDFSNKEGAYYLVGMFGQNLIYAIIGAALSIFYTDVVGIDIAVVGIVFWIARLWDAVNDPIMGVVLERTKSRWGKFRPYLKYMPIPVAMITIALFAPISNLPMGGKIAYLLVLYLLWSPIYTLCDIPLWSAPSLMIPDENRRTRLIAAARVVGYIGGVLTAVFAPIKNALGKLDLGWFENVGLPNYDGYFSQEQGYFLAVLILAIIGAILFKFIFPNVRERVSSNSTGAQIPVKESLKIVFRNKPFMRLMISGILGATKTLLLTAGIYFCKWVMGDGYEGMWVVYLGAPYLVGLLISMAISPRISDKLSKKKVYIWSSYISAIPMFILYFVCFKDLTNIKDYLWLMLVMLGVQGFFSGFSAMLHPAMIADSVDYSEWKEGERADGIYFSGLTFIAKLTAALAILISNILLGAVAYSATVDYLNAEIATATLANQIYELNFAAEYYDITNMMFILITLVPAAGCILSAIPIHRYTLTDEKMVGIRADLKERRAHYANAINAEGGSEAEVLTDETTDSGVAEVTDVTETTENEVVQTDEVTDEVTDKPTDEVTDKPTDED